MELRKFNAAKGPARIKGVVWQYSESAKGWARAVLRIHADKTQYWGLTTRVNPDQPYCMKCLSNNIEPKGLRQNPGEMEVATFHCNNCTLDQAVVVR